MSTSQRAVRLLWLGNKGRYSLLHLWTNLWVAGKLCDPLLTGAIPEHFRDEQLIIKCRVRTIPVLGIGQYLPVLGGIGIAPILFLVVVPNTGQTTVCGAIWPRRSDKPYAGRLPLCSLQIVGKRYTDNTPWVGVRVKCACEIRYQ